MLRSIFVPSILALIVATPFLFSKSNTKQNSAPTGAATYQAGYGVTSNGNGNGNGTPTMLPSTQSFGNYGSGGTNPFYQANATLNSSGPNASFNSPLSSQNAPLGNPNLVTLDNPALGQVIPSGGMPQFGFSPTAGGLPGQAMQPDFSTMTPDYGAAQTFVLPGNAHGPNLNAQPLEFLPVTNFEEIFRFDINPSWIKQRWKRVSTSPAEQGLHGLRVALITGTNSWDLHGSLTYFLDSSHRVQRITFRGWAGDASKLTNLLTQRYGFRPQQTHWAGFYIAQKKRTPTGGLLMQHPTVIQTDNPVQQVAIVLEINNPAGKSVLSQEFHSLIQGSMSTR